MSDRESRNPGETVTGEKKVEPRAARPAESQPDLPGGTPKDERPAAGGSARPEPVEGRPTVLVVDDKGDHREIIVAALEGAGYRMLEAGDADSALTLLRQEGPDLVFLDLQLRGSAVDGVQLLATLKRERPGLPVVAYTAWAIPEMQEKARAAGCDDYLVKPVDLAELRAIAYNYLGSAKPRATTDPGPHPDTSQP